VPMGCANAIAAGGGNHLRRRVCAGLRRNWRLRKGLYGFPSHSPADRPALGLAFFKGAKRVCGPDDRRLRHAHACSARGTASGRPRRSRICWFCRSLLDHACPGGYVLLLPHGLAQGKKFVIGHVLLTSLFLARAASYLGLVLWHVCIKTNR
jgi:hypothetical protein